MDDNFASGAGRGQISDFFSEIQNLVGIDHLQRNYHKNFSRKKNFFKIRGYLEDLSIHLRSDHDILQSFTNEDFSSS